MDSVIEKTFPAQRDHITEMLEFVRHAAERFGLPENLLMPLSLIVDEAVVNVCDYAYWDVISEGEKPVDLSLRKIDGGIELHIADHGKAFDPLGRAEPDLDLPLEQREPGGLGIFLIRQFASEVRYQRLDDRNVLTVRMIARSE